jgi:hypothetical protein
VEGSVKLEPFLASASLIRYGSLGSERIQLLCNMI